MTTFGQWMNSLAKPARITFVSGRVPVLMNEVVGSIVHHLDPGYVEKIAASESFWHSFAQKSLTNDNFIYIVPDAQNIKSWEKLHDLFLTIRSTPGLYVIFISDAEITDELKSIFQTTPSLCQNIICNGLSYEAPKDKKGISTRSPDIVLWLQSWAPKLSPLIVLHIMDRVGGDLYEARNFCQKIEMFDTAITQTIVDALLPKSVGALYVEALIKNDKSTAMESIPKLTPETFHAAIGLLDWYLTILGIMNDMHKSFKSRKDAMCEKSIPNVAVVRYWESARDWPANARSRAYKALAAVDGTKPAHGLSGAPETLVSLW